jgi:APA family basic amino acid/polyamine antiporter
VIQTGTIAAVGVAFGKFAGYLFPQLGDENILIGTARQLSHICRAAGGIVIIVFLTFPQYPRCKEAPNGYSSSSLLPR